MSHKGSQGKRFGKKDVRTFEENLTNGNYLDADAWRTRSCGSQNGVRSTLRAAAQSIIREYGGLPLPSSELQMEDSDARALGYTAILKSNL